MRANNQTDKNGDNHKERRTTVKKGETTMNLGMQSEGNLFG